MEHDRQNFFVILDRFLTFYAPPPNDSEIQNFAKMKKATGDIIILHKCSINYNYMMYVSSDMEHDGSNFWSFSTTFCPFTPQTTQQIKIFEKMKKTPEDIIILHRCTKNHDHMLHCS